MNDNDIIKYFYSDKSGNPINRISRYKLANISNDIKEYLKLRYSDNSTDNIKESIFRIKNNIENIPTCPVCGNKVIFNGIYYPTVCSNTCRGKLSYITMSKKYGVKNIFDIYKEQTQKTLLEKYGVTNISKSKIIKEKKKNTFIKHYGVENNFCRGEIKEKNKELIKNSKDIILEKRRKTNINKYGVEYFLSLNKGKSLSEEHKKKIGITIKSESFQTYRTNKLKENNTFNKSYVEEAFFILLKKKYNEVKRQYKSNEYPFNCDFYIPEINTYIEIQGSHFHHLHPFNKNDKNDIIELNRLKSLVNSHPQYENIIKTWTIYDVEKREIAKRNNLNFIELFPKDYKDNEELNVIIEELRKNKIFKK